VTRSTWYSTRYMVLLQSLCITPTLHKSLSRLKRRERARVCEVPLSRVGKPLSRRSRLPANLRHPSKARPSDLVEAPLFALRPWQRATFRFYTFLLRSSLCVSLKSCTDGAPLHCSRRLKGLRSSLQLHEPRYTTTVTTQHPPHQSLVQTSIELTLQK
jgi:hypothetical protein